MYPRLTLRVFKARRDSTGLLAYGASVLVLFSDCLVRVAATSLLAFSTYSDERASLGSSRVLVLRLLTVVLTFF